MTSFRESATQMPMAIAVALVGGCLVGFLEGIVVLQANAYAQPSHYGWLYLSVPVLSWMVLAFGMLTPLALALWLAGRPPPSALLAGVLAFVAAAALMGPVLLDVQDRLAAVGAPSALLRLAIWTGLLAVCSVLSVSVAAGTAWLEARRPRALRQAAVGAGLLGVACMVPAIRFVASDWRLTSGDNASARSSELSPNVVLISIDTLRSDHLGAYGASDEPTPQLDRVAREGVLFEQAVTASPWTLPAMGSLLTGAYPSKHGAGRITNGRTPLGRSPLASGSWTLATALRESGYRTQAIVTNPYLSLHYGLGQGFDGYANVTIESEAFLTFRETALVRLATWAWPELQLGDRGRVVSERAVAWLEQNARHQPFLLWLHYVDPHPPYDRSGASGRKSFRGDTLLGASQRPVDLTLTSPDVARLRSGEIRLSPAEKAAVADLYRAEVRSVDTAVGEVLDQVDRLGLGRTTLVVIVADHGEEFWEHGGVEHGHTVYDEVIRIPLVMRLPGRLPAGGRVPSLVSIVDVAPSVLEILELPAPSDRDGQSLVPLIGTPDPPSRAVLIENMLFADERVGLRTEKHKYVRWEIGKEEAYDLDRDPREFVDLSGLDEVRVPLQRLYEGARDTAPHAGDLPTEEKPLDAATVEAMRALGYAH